MCYNCGCHIPEDNMGDERNITTSTFENLAKEWTVQPKAARKKMFDYLTNNLTNDKEIEKVFEEASKAWGQSIQDAKRETANLLKHEF